MSCDDKGNVETSLEGEPPLELETSKEEESFNSHDSLPTDNDTERSEPPPFDFINENVYIIEKGTSRDGKRSKRMMCNCQFDPETDNLSEACGDNCLNRLLMIECGSRCPCGEYCNNKRFTRKKYTPAEVIKTEKKGWGLKATADVAPYSFVMEYCGEVCTIEEFERRRTEYEKDKRRHYYFMSLKTDAILDATKKGNYSRFINHSCNPNCETQKWTVNGRLCVGFFSLCHISAGEELTFDYQFQRFGESAQKCYCGSDNCRGYLGATKQSDTPLVSGGIGKERKGVGKRRGEDSDTIFEKELYDVVGSAWRLKNIDQVLSFSRLMLRAESLRQRTMLLKVLQATNGTVCLKRFLSFQGLRLLWSWMVELTDQHTAEALEAKEQVLLSLQCLPIPNKNVLTDNKILQLVQKWAETKSSAQSPDQESVVISEADCSISQDNEIVKDNDTTENDNRDEMKCQNNDNDKITSPVTVEALEDKSVHDDEEVSIDEGSEAEGREAIPVITDDDSKIVNLASDLLTKWSSLKEVFRIPKKPMRPKVELTVVPLSSSDSELQQRKYNESDEVETNKGKRKRDSRWESNDSSKVKLNSNTESNTSSNNTGLLGSPPVGYPPALQNTLIVQGTPGQSLYVQQQIFPSPGPHGLFQTPAPRLITPSGPTHRLIPVTHQHRLITPTPSHGFPTPPHGLITPPTAPHCGSVTHLQPHVFLPSPSPLLPSTVPQRLTTPVPSHGSPALVTSVPHGLAPPYGSASTVPSLHGLDHGTPPNGSTQYVPVHLTTTTTLTSLQPVAVTTSSSVTDVISPPPPPTDEKELPPNWKKTQEPSGKWDRPTEDDRDGDILMDIATPDIDDEEGEDSASIAAVGGGGQPHTPEDSPPSSPLSQPSPTKKSSITAPKDVFKHSLSKLIVRCLDHHRKPNCKYGRITCSEDFKHLARKLTFGITEKELARKGSTDALEFSDQVKTRAKAYIKNYMKKFGPVYSHS